MDGLPLHRVDLTGQDTVLVIPDRHDENWHDLAPRVEFARVDLPVADFPYRYRLVASIVLAEVTRQLGPPSAGRPPRKRLTYDSALTFTGSDVDLVGLDELNSY